MLCKIATSLVTKDTLQDWVLQVGSRIERQPELPRMSLHLTNQSNVLVCGLSQFLGKTTVQVDILQLRLGPLGIGAKRSLCLVH